MKQNVSIAISSRIAEKTDMRNLLQRFLSHAYAGRKDRNEKWMEKVKHDIHTLCVTSALFDLNKQWQENPLIPAPSLRALYGRGRLDVTIGSSRVTTWMTQLKEVLDLWYPKQFSTPEHIAVSTWSLPVQLFGVALLGRVGEIRRRIVRKNKKVITSKVSAHIRTCYIVGWPDIFWFAIANLLEEFASDCIRCTECRKLFLKTKRQGYCSSACRIRRWRRDNPLRMYEIRRKAYVSEVHEKLPRASVHRRGPRLFPQSKEINKWHAKAVKTEG